MFTWIIITYSKLFLRLAYYFRGKVCVNNRHEIGSIIILLFKKITLLFLLPIDYVAFGQHIKLLIRLTDIC